MRYMTENIIKIRARTREFAELQQSYHFLYDLPLSKTAWPPKYVVMGTNPGEPRGTREKYAGDATEETSSYDFHVERTKDWKRPERRESLHWSNRARKYLETDAIVFSEFFFWSSLNEGTAFEERFGCPLGKSQHLGFCTEMNKDLVNHYQPKAVVIAGFGFEFESC